MEYGDFVTGRLVSKAEYESHLHRYLFAAQYATDKTCLDVGCGTGYGTHHLARHASHVIGVDRDPTAVKLAKEYSNASNVTFIESDAATLPLQSTSVDMTVAFEIIEHLRNPLTVLAEIHRVLRPGGTLILSTPNRGAGPFFWATNWRQHIHEYTLNELIGLVKLYFGQFELYGQLPVDGSSVMARRLRRTVGRTLEALGLRRLQITLGKLLPANRPVRPGSCRPGKQGQVQPLPPGADTLLVVCRKPGARPHRISRRGPLRRNMVAEPLSGV